MSCIGTPISWLRLESYAIDRVDPTIAQHLATCPACSSCFAEIRDDVVALPALVVPDQPSRRWLRWLVPAMAVAAAAAIVVIVRPAPEHREVTTIKGAGEIVLGVVRERNGTIRTDVSTFLPGDRWKVILTCAPGPTVWVEVTVADPLRVDTPIGPVQIECGNEVAVPGAFSLTGHDDNVVCARVDTARLLPSVPHVGDPGVACVTLRPELPR